MPGSVGNSIIAGHRDTHFAFLRDLERGERLAIETTGGSRHVYEVIDLQVVDSRKGSLALDTSLAMLTLVTCYPFDALEPGGPLRYVVTAQRVH
jgi:sortase A